MRIHPRLGTGIACIVYFSIGLIIDKIFQIQLLKSDLFYVFLCVTGIGTGIVLNMKYRK